jgi:hypothetical protein
MTARRPSPAARARRALAIDLALALLIAAVALQLAAGLGVVAFFALPVLLLGLLWIGAERLLGRIAQRRRSVA